MATLRTERREQGFEIIPRESLQDENLSLKARGMLGFLLSMPEKWQFTISDITNRMPDGRHSVSTALDELEEHGYLERQQSRNDGAFSHNDWIIRDTTISCVSRFPDDGFPDDGKSPTIYNTYRDYTVEDSTQQSSSKSNDFSDERLPIGSAYVDLDTFLDDLPDDFDDQSAVDRSKHVTRAFDMLFCADDVNAWDYHGQLIKLSRRLDVDPPFRWMIRTLFEIRDSDTVDTHVSDDDDDWNEALARRIIQYLGKLISNHNEGDVEQEEAFEELDAYIADL